MDNIKHSAALVLLGFLLSLGAWRGVSSVHGSGLTFSGVTLKGATESGVFQAGFAFSAERPVMSPCACCTEEAEEAEEAELYENAAQSGGRVSSCCGRGTSAQEKVDGGCGRCPVKSCGSCCGYDSYSLFLGESVSSVPDPGRWLPALLENWKAARRTLRPLLQPPREV